MAAEIENYEEGEEFVSEDSQARAERLEELASLTTGQELSRVSAIRKRAANALQQKNNEDYLRVKDVEVAHAMALKNQQEIDEYENQEPYTKPESILGRVGAAILGDKSRYESHSQHLEERAENIKHGLPRDFKEPFDRYNVEVAEGAAAVELNKGLPISEYKDEAGDGLAKGDKIGRHGKDIQDTIFEVSDDI